MHTKWKSNEITVLSTRWLYLFTRSHECSLHKRYICVRISCTISHFKLIVFPLISVSLGLCCSLDWLIQPHKFVANMFVFQIFVRIYSVIYWFDSLAEKSMCIAYRGAPWCRAYFSVCSLCDTPALESEKWATEIWIIIISNNVNG